MSSVLGPSSIRGSLAPGIEEHSPGPDRSVTQVTDRLRTRAHTGPWEGTTEGSTRGNSGDERMKTMCEVTGGAAVGGAPRRSTDAVGPWGYIGVVPLLTAAMGICPLYTVFGFSTCPVRKA